LNFSLQPGYGIAETTVPHTEPTISLKFGLLPDGRNLTYEVLNDPLGIYQNPSNEYRQVSFEGIPGGVDGLLRAQPCAIPCSRPLRAVLNRCAFVFFTNGGVREYEFAAPPVFQEYVETLVQTAERINKCKRLGVNLVLRKFLGLKWRIDPHPVGVRFQLWEIHVHELERGRVAWLSHQATGALLAEGYADDNVTFFRRGAPVRIAGLQGEEETDEKSPGWERTST
jgi:hypothetical protein